MTYELIPIPLVVQPTNRNTSASKDAKVLNCIVETMADKSRHVMQRPGIQFGVDLQITPGSNFGGVTFFKTKSYIIFDAVFYIYDSTLTLVNQHNIEAPVGEIYTMGSYRTTSGNNETLLVKSNKVYRYFDTPSSTMVDVTAAVTTAGAVAPFKPGVVVLDGAGYILDANDRIYGTNTGGLSTWNALNFIGVTGDNDAGVALSQQLNYVVAFKDTSIEFYYNAGNPTGTPLARNDSAKNSTVGCGSARSIYNYGGTLIWQYKTNTGGKGFAIMENLQVKVISTPSVERMLVDSDKCISFGFTSNGHTYYCAYIPSRNVTMVYDINESEWYEWTYADGHMPFLGTVLYQSSQYLIHESNGKTYNTSIEATGDEIVEDVFTVIVSDIVTSRYDRNTVVMKQCARIELVSDVIPTGVIRVRYSDDDYVTWSDWYDVPLLDYVNFITRLGSFRRRAFWLRFSGTTPFRLTHMNIGIQMGSA